jgi:predicted PurR-regulated permease PerM
MPPTPRFPAARRVHVVAAWIIAGVLLVGALLYGLLPALFSGLLVYELVHLITPKLRVIHARAGQLAAVIVLAMLVVGALAALFFAGVSMLHAGSSGYAALVRKIGDTVEQSRLLLPRSLLASLPPDADSVRSEAVAWLRNHAAMIGTAGRSALETIVHILIGMVIGGMVSLLDVLPDKQHGPLGRALGERVARFAEAFRRIVFAQVRIAALNTAFTAVYLIGVLPLMGVHLPFAKTVLVITFVGGLLPVVGNLISNTIIVLLSFSISVELALGSLAFLVIVHKLEYFLNARIVGGRIEASAWELLIAMLVMQAVFGLPGIVAAPVYYAYLKDELNAAQLL